MRVYPDTNVLFPVRLLNLIMRSHSSGLIEVVWTDELLAELERVLFEKKGVQPVQARAITKRLSEWAPAGRVDPSRYRQSLGGLIGPDQSDHVHAAAARVAADVLLSNNLSDFPADDVHPCRLATPAQLFGELGATYPVEFARVLRESSLGLRHLRRTPLELLNDLRDVGLVEFADRVEPYLR